MGRTLEGRVRRHFTSRGYEEVAREPGHEPEGHLLFKDGDSLMLARVVSKQELNDRNAILKLLLALSPGQARVNKVYLALPKRYTAAIDGSVLREKGIGVLAYDEDSVQEVIPPSLFATEQATSSSEGLEDLRHDLGELSRLYTELKAEVSEVREELAQLRLDLAQHGDGQERVIGRRQAAEVPRAASKAVKAKDQPTPGFFKDNPWLDVLSRRGRQDDAGERTGE